MHGCTVFIREPSNAHHALRHFSRDFQTRYLRQKGNIRMIESTGALGLMLNQAQSTSHCSDPVPSSTAPRPQCTEMKPFIFGEVAGVQQCVPPSPASLIEKGYKLNSTLDRGAFWGANSTKCNSITCSNARSFTPEESPESVCLSDKQEQHMGFQHNNDFQKAGTEERGQPRFTFSETASTGIANPPFGELCWGIKSSRPPSNFSLYGNPASSSGLLPKPDLLRGRCQRRSVALLEPHGSGGASRAANFLPALRTASNEAKDGALSTSDEDVVLDTPSALLSMLEGPDSAKGFETASKKEGKHLAETDSTQYHSPATRGVGQDVIDLVTDAFIEQREAVIEKRRQVLYAMTHPSASDYTYGKKLVPPPPLSFGRVTAEAIQLGNEMLLGQRYFLVNQSGSRVDATTPPNALSVSSSPALRMVETGVEDRTTQSISKSKSLNASASARPSPYRGRAREGNIFRDHRYFFEINDLYQEIVLVGKACAGKSSLLNALLGQSVAKTSSTPNTTRKISFYQSVTPEALQAFHARNHHNLVKLPGGGLQLTFVDIPGFGIEGMSDKWRDAAIELTDAYFGVRRSVNTVLFCIDCDRGLTKTDLKYFQWLENVQGVFFPVLTKCDIVPHSRVCSVMRQIYTLITEKRRKYRKVFPFVVPTSSKDGTNIDILRGLITESSGMIPGDRLRELLQLKQTESMKEALVQESLRLGEVARLEREQAREQLKLTNSGQLPQLTSPLGSPPSSQWNMKKMDCGPLDMKMDRNENRHYRLSIRKENMGPKKSQFGPLKMEEGDANTQMRHGKYLGGRKCTNPIVRECTPYGEVRFRLHSGIDGLDSDTVDLTYKTTNREANPTAPMLRVNKEKESKRIEKVTHEPAGGDPTPAPSPSSLAGGSDSFATAAAVPTSLLSPEPSRVVGWPPSPAVPAETKGFPTDGAVGASNDGNASPMQSGGSVSRFLDVMEQFSTQKNRTPAKCSPLKQKKLHEKEEKWLQQQAKGYTPSLLVQEESGRLSEFKAGKRCGPALVSLNTKVDSRQAEWRGKELKALLNQYDSKSPWSAMNKITQTIENERQRGFMKGMKPKDLAAYLRNAGSVIKSFEKFEGEVTAAKYMNEVRQAKTLRSREQMHLNATAKINWRSMPPGLWKQYGKKDTYWTTSSVLGRENDESHAASYPPQTY